jgi:hypothetical protein
MAARVDAGTTVAVAVARARSDVAAGPDLAALVDPTAAAFPARLGGAAVVVGRVRGWIAAPPRPAHPAVVARDDAAAAVGIAALTLAAGGVRAAVDTPHARVRAVLRLGLADPIATVSVGAARESRNVLHGAEAAVVGDSVRIAALVLLAVAVGAARSSTRRKWLGTLAVRATLPRARWMRRGRSAASQQHDPQTERHQHASTHAATVAARATACWLSGCGVDRRQRCLE